MNSLEEVNNSILDGVLIDRPSSSSYVAVIVTLYLVAGESSSKVALHMEIFVTSALDESIFVLIGLLILSSTIVTY